MDITGINLIPPHDHLGEVIGPLLPSGCDNAKTLTHLMELSTGFWMTTPSTRPAEPRASCPANGVWFWAEGTGVALGSFVDKYGKTGTVISAVPLCQGIARLGSLKAVEVEGATGELDTNYEGKTHAALDCLADGDDFVAIHVEAPDECTHNGDTPGKLQAIEWLSSRVVGPLVAGMDKAGYDYRTSSSPTTRPFTSPAATTATRCPTSSTTAAPTPTTTCPTPRKLA